MGFCMRWDLRKSARTGKYPPWMVRAIVKAGGNPVRNPSEIDHQIACMSIQTAEARCEAAKARAMLRAVAMNQRLRKLV